MKNIILLILSIYTVNFSQAQKFDYLPTSTTNEVIQHTYYTLSYSEQHEQAEWVAYELNKSRLNGNHERTNNFRRDHKVKTGSSFLSDYEKKKL